MNEGKRLRLSQCMIVKNEEKNIERALAWGRGIVDEQIVVDTGSTDRTVELAKAMGASVFHFDWIDDFSAAKNFAISKASGDWIAFLDADEYFLPSEAEKLMPILEKLDRTTGYALRTAWLNVREDETVYMGGTQVRIFRRIPGLRYRNPIHEELFLEGEPVFRVTDATKELAIYHTGYAGGEEQNLQKKERNARIILKELEKDPDNYNLMGYLGDVWYSPDMSNEKAKEWYCKAIDRMPPQVDSHGGRTNVTFWRLMLILSHEENENELVKIYQKAVKLLPEDSDFDYVLGRFYMDKKKDFEKAAPHFKRSLELLETYGNANMGYLVTGAIQETWYFLALCYYQAGELNECVKYCMPPLKANPWLMSTLVLLLRALKTEGDDIGSGRQVAGFLENFYDMSELKARIFLLRAAREAGFGGVEQIIRGLCSEEELGCFDKEMK